jgi:hypothetical protein
VTFLHKPIGFFVAILGLPVALYYLANGRKQVPKYLVCLMLFTAYSLYSVFANNSMPDNTSPFFFILNDASLLACILFIIIENIEFTEKEMNRLTRGILLVVGISLVVSVLQMKDTSIFFNPNMEDGLIGLGEERNSAFSIYSWVALNSVSVTFPALIAILVNFYEPKRLVFYIILLSAIIVPFLNKGRAFMIATLVVLSQLIFDSQRALSKRVTYVFGFVIGIFFLIAVAGEVGINIQEIIDNRILEKDSDMASAKSRLTSYTVFMKVFPENPVFGVGPKTQDNVIDLLLGEANIIHVGYLAYLYYYGILGCIFIFLALFFLLKETWIVGKRSGFWGSFYAFLAFAFGNFTFEYFVFSEMGLVLAVLYMRYYGGPYLESLKQPTELKVA